MRITSNLLLFLFIIFFTLPSCKDNNSSTSLLQQAETSFETNPKQTLLYLNSITNPKDMEKDAYIRYIMMYVGAKKETKKDITSDTFIYEAQNYFQYKDDSKASALSNYYAGWVYYLNKNLHLALESFMNAAYYGQKINNSLLSGNSLNNIGYIYFEKDQYDSAIVNYKKALPYYSKVKNVDIKVLTTLTNIGRSYDANNNLDSASIYFDKCLSLAKEIKKEEYQFHSLQNLGVTSLGQQQYQKAIEYFQSALAMNTSFEAEKNQINLYILRIYNKQHDLKSAKQYVGLVIASLPKVTFKYTTREMYTALADYYQQLGDYKQALQYSSLEKTTLEEITQESDAAALLAADKRFHMAQQARENREFEFKMFMFLTIAVTGLVVSLFFVFLFRWTNKKEYAIIQQQLDNIYEMRKDLASMREESIRGEDELKSMLEDDKLIKNQDNTRN